MDIYHHPKIWTQTAQYEVSPNEAGSHHYPQLYEQGLSRTERLSLGRVLLHDVRRGGQATHTQDTELQQGGTQDVGPYSMAAMDHISRQAGPDTQ